MERLEDVDVSKDPMTRRKQRQQKNLEIGIQFNFFLVTISFFPDIPALFYIHSFVSCSHQCAGSEFHQKASEAGLMMSNQKVMISIGERKTIFRMRERVERERM